MTFHRTHYFRCLIDLLLPTVFIPKKVNDPQVSTLLLSREKCERADWDWGRKCPIMRRFPWGPWFLSVWIGWPFLSNSNWQSRLHLQLKELWIFFDEESHQAVWWFAPWYPDWEWVSWISTWYYFRIFAGSPVISLQLVRYQSRQRFHMKKFERID